MQEVIRVRSSVLSICVYQWDRVIFHEKVRTAPKNKIQIVVCIL